MSVVIKANNKMSPGGTQAVMPPSTSIERVMENYKRKFDGDDVLDVKRPRINLYFRLESESSLESDGDAESVYSIQDKETDVARDTSDTDTKSENSELEVELEYDVESLSGVEEFPDNYSSSGTEDFQAAEGAIAAVLCDSSLEAWATDGETTSDTSSIGDLEISVTEVRKDFWTCLQCKSRNDNPLFRYCEKCFQVRKSFFPPRPRGTRKRKLVEKQEPPKVKLDALQSCLNRLSQEAALSQDSGLGSSQELTNLDFKKIVVPEHTLKRKHTASESSVDLFEDEAPPQKAARQLERPENSKRTTNLNRDDDDARDKDLCIMCNSSPKNGIFLHGSIGHMCCCYKCAMRSWKSTKRCPICNCKVKNVVKLFTV